MFPMVDLPLLRKAGLPASKFTPPVSLPLLLDQSSFRIIPIFLGACVYSDECGFLPCCLIQNYAGRDSCVQRFHTQEMGDHDQLIHLSYQLLVQAGAFVADKDCGSAAKICLRKCCASMR